MHGVSLGSMGLRKLIIGANHGICYAPCTVNYLYLSVVQRISTRLLVCLRRRVGALDLMLKCRLIGRCLMSVVSRT
jgi:hypothetical protein